MRLHAVDLLGDVRAVGEESDLLREPRLVERDAGGELRDSLAERRQDALRDPRPCRVEQRDALVDSSKNLLEGDRESGALPRPALVEVGECLFDQSNEGFFEGALARRGLFLPDDARQTEEVARSELTG